MKRIISILLSLILCTTLVACGDAEEPVTSTQDTTAVTTTEETIVSTTTISATTKSTTATTKSKTTTTTKASSKKAKTTKKSKTSSDYKEEVLALVNAERINAGLCAVTLNSTLCECAMTRAKEMAEVGDNSKGLSHTRPNGESCFTAVKGKVSYSTCGENIAWFSYTSCTSSEVMEGWMESEGHRANILSSDYKELGIARADGVDGTYWCQIFIG